MRPYKKVSVSIKHAKEKDFDKVKQIFNENRKLFPHIRNDYIRGIIKRGYGSYEKLCKSAGLSHEHMVDNLRKLLNR